MMRDILFIETSSGVGGELMNNKLKRTVAVLFTLVTIIIGFYLYLPPCESIVETMNVTVGEDRVDILFVGCSHTFNGINPVQMYKDCGYAAYDLAVGAQAPWQSYYYIKEACKTQSPKLIVLDTYMLGSVQDVDEHYKDYQTVNNLLNCPISVNHLKAVWESEAESKLSLILRFPYTYNKRENWNGLSIKKYIGEIDYSLGYLPFVGTTPYENRDVSKVKECLPINPKNERYLRKTIEFCKESGVQLLLMNTPWPDITEDSQKYFNTIQRIASENGVLFANGCLYYPEMGIDYQTDCYGGGHLNHNGVTKYTKWLEDFISCNYQIEDRRGNKDYNSYEMAVEWMDKLENEATDE